MSQPAAAAASVADGDGDGGCLGAAAVKIVSHPPSYSEQHDPSNLLDDESHYWASAGFNVANQAFVFQAPQSCVLARFDWKGAHNPDVVPTKLSLEAQVEGSWAELAVWDAPKIDDYKSWRSQPISRRLNSHSWRLTVLANGGNGAYVAMGAVKFLVRYVPACSTISARLWADRKFADVAVLVGERRFHVHRNVLATASPVFERMLQAEMKEVQTGEIRLEETDEASVVAALEYIYCGELPEHAPYGVTMLAHKYDITGLMEVAIPRALENITVGNVTMAIQMLRPYRDDGQLGIVWHRLKDMVHKNAELFDTAMLEL